ncbi:glycosyl hydrolase [Actinomyces faecalis]|uniref:glycosyl hydrolase n=1 Tax=Actinomyces faecalis TaxID=2722820 RepID=UPI0015569283|nr:glycosyl hydrolase [Actinomyces faecalis]
MEIAFSPGFWADDAQREALAAVLAEAARLDVGVAMTLGAAWPLQTPNTASGTEYAAQELQYGVRWIDGDRRSHTTPVPLPFDDPGGVRPSRLVAVVAARVHERGRAPRVVPSGSPWGQPTKIDPPLHSTVIDEDSLTVLTPAVRTEGTNAVVTWAPGPGRWAVTAFWSRDSEQGAASFLDARATRAALSYLDEHQVGGCAQALTAPGSTAVEMFEDSLELNANCLFWVPDMLERFASRHGDDLTRYLPLLMVHGQCRYWVPQDDPRPDFVGVRADGKASDLGRRVRSDYERLLTDLYVSEHLHVIQGWARGHGMRYKTQAAYGQNLEPVRSFRELVRCGGRAEVESLNSGDRVPMRMDFPTWRFSVDWQRSCISGAHQGGALRVSTELGAQMDRCYDFGLPDYRQMLDKEWALGVTKPFVHGFASQAPDAPWPTQGRFGTIVSESWNHRHFPQWEAWKALTGYWARGTAVLETGTPRTDVAVYRDGFLTTAARGSADDDATAPDRLIDAEPLERAGYGVQVLDPVGLAEPGVVGQDATGTPVLFPDGPAYRALVLETSSLTADAARALADAAEAGLAVVVVGPPPARDTGWGGHDRSAQVADDVVRALAAARTRRVADWDEVPAALADLGVRPRAGWRGPVLLSQVRDADEGRLVLVYNPDADSAVSLTLDVEGEGAATVIDLDAGALRPVAARSAEGRTLVDLALAPLGLAIVRVGAPALAAGAQPQAPVRVAGALVGTGARTEALAPCGQALGLVWGELVVTAEEEAGARTLTLDGQGPADWREVPGLTDVSGTGRYRARVTGADGAPVEAGLLAGARLSLGRVGGVATVSVGGSVLATVLRPDDVVEVGSALADEVAAGRELVIEIEVRTTLRNATLAADVYMTGPWPVEHPSVPHGLLGPVRLLV